MRFNLFRQSDIPEKYRSNFRNLYLDIAWFGVSERHRHQLPQRVCHAAWRKRIADRLAHRHICCRQPLPRHPRRSLDQQTKNGAGGLLVIHRLPHRLLPVDSPPLAFRRAGADLGAHHADLPDGDPPHAARRRLSTPSSPKPCRTASARAWLARAISPSPSPTCSPRLSQVTCSKPCPSPELSDRFCDRSHRRGDEQLPHLPHPTGEGRHCPASSSADT
jgi:hypothetical protein